MKLNMRQDALYNYLLEKGDVWMKQIEVVYDLCDYYDTWSFEEDKEFHDSKARIMLTRDIQIVNMSEAEKVIITSSKGIKLANEQEFAKYIKGQYAKVFRMLKRVRIKESKGKANNKVVFDENGDFEIIESFLKKHLTNK